MKTASGGSQFRKWSGEKAQWSDKTGKVDRQAAGEGELGGNLATYWPVERRTRGEGESMCQKIDRGVGTRD